MNKINIYFDELYRYDRIDEHCFISIPFKKGVVKSLDNVQILDDNIPLKLQKKITAKWEDGSVKWAFFRFMGTLPKYNKKVFVLDADYGALEAFDGTVITNNKDSFIVDNKVLSFTLAPGKSLFEKLTAGSKVYDKNTFSGPILKDSSGKCYDASIDKWSIIEEGPLVNIFSGTGSHTNGDTKIDYVLTVTSYYGKPWVNINYRIINTTDLPLEFNSLYFNIALDSLSEEGNNYIIPPIGFDSTGCGDIRIDLNNQDGPIYHTSGITDLGAIEANLSSDKPRVCVGASNYKTDFYIRNDSGSITRLIDSTHIIKEANEHLAEVMYGTFFADTMTNGNGVCATIYQAHQNYPKSLTSSASGINIGIVPECTDKVIMQSGMSKGTDFLLHFYENENLAEIDNRSLIYQLPDLPYISPKDIADSGAVIDVFVKSPVPEVEFALTSKADNHAKAYGMMNFGDAPDNGYTRQGRGNGELVWTNNEYDFPHACALMYMRTGTRRFYDYMRAATLHWMDVDICHYSSNPLHINGQWEHTNGHCKNGTMVCSHEWVEGLLDYYHLTGDKRAYSSAIAIGKNVERLLETPMFSQCGQANARETGWALRTLVALYNETYDETWLEKGDWIVGHFKEWEEEYGHWLAPYTDNTLIRVPFMISIAIGSLMRYYRVKPSEDVKNMIIRSVDDMIENCYLPTNVFYYKGLPSLNRLGGNTLVLEALTIAFELTGNLEYLNYGLTTLRHAIRDTFPPLGGKNHTEDTVLTGTSGTKNFAQCFLPITLYYKALCDNNMDDLI